MRVVEIVLASVLGLVGLRAAARGYAEVTAPDARGSRILLALHEAARAGFWLSLAAFFLGYALLVDPEGLRWFVLVPIAMAGLRLGAATLLGRREG